MPSVPSSCDSRLGWCLAGRGPLLWVTDLLKLILFLWFLDASAVEEEAPSRCNAGNASICNKHSSIADLSRALSCTAVKVRPVLVSIARLSAL
eukprot:s363_g6.t1